MLRLGLGHLGLRQNDPQQLPAGRWGSAQQREKVHRRVQAAAAAQAGSEPGEPLQRGAALMPSHSDSQMHSAMPYLKNFITNTPPTHAHMHL
mmetsp:Transcript_44648/g.80867  ORF Transcript_44648/g.80867 Transcript_44648/m.80867 type:complete len:92 (+) Transcript_44648:302-577(+)